MKLTIKKDNDGIAWLRNLRREIAAKCGNDLAQQSALYHEAAGKHSYKPYKGEAAVVGEKKKLPRAA